MPGISHVLLFLTYRCNLRCDFCLSFNRYWRADSRLPLPAAIEPARFLKRVPEFREMTTADIVERVIPQCEAAGVDCVALSGGEVLVRRDAVEIFRALGASRLRWCMDSNLMLCHEPVAEAIVETGCDAVFVSLDGAREAVHNQLRCSPKAYEKAMLGLDNLAEARRRSGSSMLIQINCVLQPGNEDEPRAMIDLATRYGVDEVGFQLLSEREYTVPFDAATAARSLGEALAEAERRGLRASVYPLPLVDEESLRAWYASPVTDRFFGGCGYVHHNLRIDPEGHVIPCLEHVLGNVLEQDLLDIWHGEPYRVFRRHLAQDGPFDACLRCCNLEPPAVDAADPRPSSVVAS